MHISSGRAGGDPRDDRGSREASALRAIERLAMLDDGTGFVLGELEATLAGLDPDVRELPSVRVASLPFLAELKLGLGDDRPVAELLEDSVARAVAGDAASRVVAIRVLRALARMDAVELGVVVKRLLRGGEGSDPVLALGLQLAAAVLDAVGPGAHPLAFPRLPGRFADRVLMAGDPELLCFFADVELAVHDRERDDRRIAEEIDEELGRELDRELGPDQSGGLDCGGAAKPSRPSRGDDFGDSAPAV
ncbi:hypothetical protein ACFWGD_07390 [Corynebacterium sp. NPDC060344]|uniref:hypothetical protein n=1 Tax=Corynebacterium sp. NPDC060344 TaxID=3347101 RepID=UPI003660DE2F